MPFILIGKLHQSSYPSNSRKSSVAPLELIYADVWGLTTIMSVGGDQLYVNFIDDFSRYNWLFPIPAKSSIWEIFIKFKAMTENQLNLKITQLHTDNGS